MFYVYDNFSVRFDLGLENGLTVKERVEFTVKWCNISWFVYDAINLFIENKVWSDKGKA